MNNDIIEQSTDRPQRRTFNYDALEPTLATDARTIANRIRGRLKQGYLATGHDLIDMKERLGHGRFGAWLTAEFGMTARTAERYMGCARFENANSDIMSEISAETMQALAAPSVPDAVRATCVDRIKAGVPVLPRDVREAASDAKYRAGSEAIKRRSLPRGKAARAGALADLANREREREARDLRAMQDRTVLVGLIVDALGEKRAEVTRLMKRLTRWSIERELLEALEAAEIGA